MTTRKASRLSPRRKVRFRVGQVVVCKDPDRTEIPRNDFPVKILGFTVSGDDVFYAVTGHPSYLWEKRFRPLTARERGTQRSGK